MRVATTQEENPQEVKRRVNAQLFLLARVALEPHTAEQQLRLLNQGIVCLKFFGISNPVPYFEVTPNGKLHQALQKAAQENLKSPMVQAACRVMRWSTLRKQRLSSQRTSTLLRGFRETLGTSFARISEQRGPAQEEALRQMAVCVENRHREIRNLRGERLARLRQAASPGVVSYHDLLADLRAVVPSIAA